MNNFSLYLNKIPVVYHVGYMDINYKVKNSYEGSGLSVSTKPESWKIILKIADRPVHKIEINQPFLDLRKIKKNDLFLNEVLDYCLKQNLILHDNKTKTGYSGTSLMCSLFFQDFIYQCNLIDFCFIYFFIKKHSVYNFFWNYPDKPLKLKAPVGVIYKHGCFD